MNEYEAKQERRRERLLERAERRESEARARGKAAEQMLDVIPPGQPILVGHHSEGRHRRDLARIDNHFRKAHEASEQAKSLRSRAAGVGSAGISSDDPDALPKLRERLAELEAEQGRDKGINRAVRKKDKAAGDADLQAMGFTEAQIAEIRTPDVMGAIGVPGYRLSNRNGNMRRLRLRIKQLEAREGDETRTTVDLDGVRVVDNVEENRVQVIFPGKPSAEVRSKLKAMGFRWAPSAGAWQRHRNAFALHQATEFAKGL